jgi:hypothetical protein
MPSLDELVTIAEAAVFIFSGSITRTGASTLSAIPVDANTVVVTVDEVIKVPDGLRNFAGSEVTVQLRHPLAAGHYVFFADPMAVGQGIAVREVAHLEGRERADALAAVERGYTARMAPRLEAAVLVALGTEGEIKPLLPPAERRARVPWALARFEIERVLKGRKLRHVTLVGPVPASKRLPRAPALRAGRYAILILQRPPEGAIEHIPEDERKGALFIAETADIQPPERFEILTQIIGATENE